MEEDTICALSTPVGTGGLAVIRVCGPESLRIAGEIFRFPPKKEGRTLAEVESHKAVFGRLVDEADGQEETLDEVLALVMKAPHTFTGEDTVELDCHGGMYICRRVLEALIRHGARMAQPGEFTKRAFLNGRMDLSEAEAVMDMISASTSYSLKSAANQLSGRLSREIEAIRKSLMDTLVAMEVNIDYPEYDVPEITDEEVMTSCRKASSSIDALLSTAGSGKILREGLSVVIVGDPNVGKSSLLNRLAGEERAIVTAIPGTTRDVIEEMIDLDGIPVKIMDTAGIRESEDVVEKLGVQKTYDSMQEADLILLVLDKARPVSQKELDLLAKIKERPHLIVVNKNDLKEADELSGKTSDALRRVEKDAEEKTVFLSAKEGTGIDALSSKIKDMFFVGGILDSGRPMVTNLRQKEALMRAREALSRVEEAKGMPQDLLSIDIRDAVSYLGQVSGLTTQQEVIDEIFKRFCLGK